MLLVDANNQDLGPVEVDPTVEPEPTLVPTVEVEVIPATDGTDVVNGNGGINWVLLLLILAALGVVGALIVRAFKSEQN